MLTGGLYLGGPAVFGRVWLIGHLGVGVRHFVAPLAWLWLRSGAGLEDNGDWLLCWLCAVGSGVVEHVGRVPSFVWSTLVVLGQMVCSSFGVGPYSWLLLRASG
ncbi:hypothetical protein XENORESO_018779 [Xenotaenia resolanae]|uniref:Uncharacterized protein n=1 Tax=Xenotaenia resolanae TaxID=208358 RepID=A0ABV0X8B7_9TELE